MCSGGAFRGIVDPDLDEFVSVDYRSPTLLYTDHACMDAYSWTPGALDTVILLIKCDDRCGSMVAGRWLYASSGACAVESAVRIVALLHPSVLCFIILIKPSRRG